MMEERPVLERVMELFQPESGILDRVYERRDRRQRRQRIAAATLALVLTAGVVAGAVAVSRSRTLPAHQPPPDLPILHNGSIDTFGFTNGVRVLDRLGIGDFVVKCDSCTETLAASWSPDGRRLAFSASCGGGCASAGDPYHGVRIADPASGSDQLILAGDGIGPIAWSPDGTHIAYVTHGHLGADGWTWDSTWSLMTMKDDGSQQDEITSGSVDQSPDSISWSPDGDRIAYAAGGRIYVVGLDGTDPTPVVDGSHVAWSRDGTSIAYLAGCDVRLTTPDGVHDRSILDLTTVGPDAVNCDAAVDLTWSPDGTALAAMVDRNVTDPIVASSRAVFVIEAAQGRGRLLVPWSGDVRTEGLTWEPVP